MMVLSCCINGFMGSYFLHLRMKEIGGRRKTQISYLLPPTSYLLSLSYV
jgi:hypothetical protein